jgi:hypothetical protein
MRRLYLISQPHMINTFIQSHVFPSNIYIYTYIQYIIYILIFETGIWSKRGPISPLFSVVNVPASVAAALVILIILIIIIIIIIIIIVMVLLLSLTPSMTFCPSSIRFYRTTTRKAWNAMYGIRRR